MSLTAFLLIVTSAVLHASWNLIAKKNHMTLPFYMMICSMGVIVWGHVQFWTPVEVWKLPLTFFLLVACSVLSDLVYCIGLMSSYSRVEMSVAYPMMRSLPIVFTVIVTMALGIGKTISPVAVAGMMTVMAGCLIMPLKNFRDFRLRDYFGKSMFFIVLTALGTTGYTVFDSVAQKYLQTRVSPDISKTVLSLTYYSTRALMLTSTLLFCSLAVPKNRQILKEYIHGRNWKPFLAGGFATCTYILVLIAMHYVTNVSYVQVFRQLGLPIGMVLGILFLKEKAALPKWVGVGLILAGLGMSLWR